MIVFKRSVAFLAVVLWCVAAYISCGRIHADDRVVRDGLTGVPVRNIRIVVNRGNVTFSAPGYLDRQIRIDDRGPITMWPSDDWEYELNIVYGVHTDSYLARPRDGVYGISLPDALMIRPQYRNHLESVIAEVGRITDGHVVLQVASEQGANVRVRPNPGNPDFYNSEGVAIYGALAYVYQDGDGYNTDADLDFFWQWHLTDADSGNALLHEVGHWLGFWHSKEIDVMGPRPDGTRFTQYSPRLTATWEMMHQRQPRNQFPDDSRIIGFARLKSSTSGTVFACP